MLQSYFLVGLADLQERVRSFWSWVHAKGHQELQLRVDLRAMLRPIARESLCVMSWRVTSEKRIGRNSNAVTIQDASRLQHVVQTLSFLVPAKTHASHGVKKLEVVPGTAIVTAAQRGNPQNLMLTSTGLVCKASNWGDAVHPVLGGPSREH